jgi:hypothetical protein
MSSPWAGRRVDPIPLARRILLARSGVVERASNLVDFDNEYHYL